MPAKWHKYSYSAQLQERRTVVFIIFLVVFLSLFFTVVHLFLVTMYKVESSTMSPTFVSGDRIITTPLYQNNPSSPPHFSLRIVPERGDLILVGPAYRSDTGFILQAIDGLVAFLSFQKVHLISRTNAWGEKPVIRRLVAFPGDSLYMDNFVLHVKLSGSAHFLTEFETTDRTYNITIDTLPENWSSGIPFSGSFPEMTLGKNQFFVLCDHRMSSSDSRVWGPIPADRIQGKVLFRYWPFSRFGKP
jgi:signal peptidase I